MTMESAIVKILLVDQNVTCVQKALLENQIVKVALTGILAIQTVLVSTIQKLYDHIYDRSVNFLC